MRQFDGCGWYNHLRFYHVPYFLLFAVNIFFVYYLAAARSPLVILEGTVSFTRW